VNDQEILDGLDGPETIPSAVIPQPRHHRPSWAEPTEGDTGEPYDPYPDDEPPAPVDGTPRPGGRRAQREERRTISRATTALPPALVTLALGAYQIGATQLRQDESATWWAAGLSWRDLFRLLDHTDVVLAPYYALLHLWVSVLGDSATMLRIPSLLAMSATAGLLALLGRRIFDAPTGLVAGLLLAVLPVTTRYAQDARPYALSTLAVVVGALLLYRALDHADADRWGGYAVGMLLTGMFHPVAATVAVAYLAIVWVTDRQRVGAWCSVTLVPVFPLLAVLVLARGQNHLEPRGGTDLTALLRLPADLLGSTDVALAVGALALAGLLLGGRVAVPLVIWAVLPPLGLFALRGAGNLFTPSYFVFTVPALALLAGAAVTRMVRALPGRPRGLATRQLAVGIPAAVALAALALPVLPALHADPQPGQPDFRAAAGYLLTSRRATDGVVYAGDVAGTTRAMAYQLRDVAHPPAQVYVTVPADLDGSYAGEPCAAPVVCTEGVTRLWLVSAGGDSPYAGLTPAQRTYLLRYYRSAGAREFAGGVRVTLLRQIPTESTG
jgi:mannosyltransferase